MIFSYHPVFFKHLQRVASEKGRVSDRRRILDMNCYHRKENPLFWIGRFMHNHIPIDRTNQLNLFDIYSEPIPTIDRGFKKTFSEICIETAQNFWNEHDDVTVLWSGGLDSTCAASAFLQTKTPGKKLTLLCSEDSVKEYPGFYEKHQSIVKIEDPMTFWGRFTVSQNATKYITGDIGDQLFGGIIDEFGGRKNADWQNFIEWDNVFRQKWMASDFLKRDWTPKEKRDFIDVLTNFNTQAPFPIVSLFDFVWWLTFSTRMTAASNNIAVLAAEKLGSDKVIRNSYSCFFYNHDFQQWSMLNHHLKYPGSLETYKQPIKDFIIDYNKDKDFITDKRKEISTPKLLGDDWFHHWTRNKETAYLVMTDGTIYSPWNDIPYDMIDPLILKTRIG